MAARVIKELKGFSGNQVLLMQKGQHIFVRKSGNVERNVERMYALADDYPLPKIYNYSKNKLDIEYISGYDMNTYLRHNNPESLLEFLINVFEKMSTDTVEYDYSTLYRQKTDSQILETLGLSTATLLKRLPSLLPQSVYHGDLTLENVICSKNGSFYLIDCQTTEYNSYIFDIAKLRQDLECLWFVRNSQQKHQIKLHYIQQQILKRFPESNNNAILILMLLRVYNYTKPESFERNFIIKEIKRLWK